MPGLLPPDRPLPAWRDRTGAIVLQHPSGQLHPRGNAEFGKGVPQVGVDRVGGQVQTVGDELVRLDQPCVGRVVGVDRLTTPTRLKFSFRRRRPAASCAPQCVEISYASVSGSALPERSPSSIRRPPRSSNSAANAGGRLLLLSNGIDSLMNCSSRWTKPPHHRATPLKKGTEGLRRDSVSAWVVTIVARSGRPARRQIETINGNRSVSRNISQ
jgi:hypothetical protein